MEPKWSKFVGKIVRIHLKLVAKTSIETREEFLGNWGGGESDGNPEWMSGVSE